LKEVFSSFTIIPTMTRDDAPCQIHIHIRYAPLQDERNVATSAALEFSKRAARIFENTTTTTTSSSAKVNVSFIGDGDGDLPTTDSANDPSVLRLTVFLISCAADGSIHREVRKLTKAVKEEEESSSSSSDNEFYAVALLGHAVCDNSAKQMADAVFGAGRRLIRALQKKKSTGGECCPVFAVETQVELDAPEEAFDGWVEGLMAKTKTSFLTTS
jgi:hypothetical protein